MPVTIVTGFLGAGKSTLLNVLLATQHGRRIAVIEIELGAERGIERLIARGDGAAQSKFVDLNNGCICCSVRDDLAITLEWLLERRSQFDYIVIETTGADPAHWWVCSGSTTSSRAASFWTAS